jgi:hypothetical protein
MRAIFTLTRSAAAAAVVAFAAVCKAKGTCFRKVVRFGGEHCQRQQHDEYKACSRGSQGNRAMDKLSAQVMSDVNALVQGFAL